MLALAALLVAGPAGAHITPLPGLVPAGETTRVRLLSPNERAAPMTGFAVEAPENTAIVDVHSSEDWTARFAETSATWSGGSLSGRETTTFELDLAVASGTEPGPVRLSVEQRYPRGKVVRWRVTLTITPGAERPAQSFRRASVAALLGGAVVAVLAVVMLWRRVTSLSES